MFFFAVGMSLNFIIWEPFACMSKMFCWPCANRVILEETENGDPNREVPKNVAEMRKFIAELGKEPERNAALKEIIKARNTHKHYYIEGQVDPDSMRTSAGDCVPRVIEYHDRRAQLRHFKNQKHISKRAFAEQRLDDIEEVD